MPSIDEIAICFTFELVVLISIYKLNEAPSHQTPRRPHSPAHGLHDVQQQRGRQVRAQVDERGEDHDGQPERLLIVLLQDGPAVVASARETENCLP